MYVFTGPHALPVLLERHRREEGRVPQDGREPCGVVGHALAPAAAPGVFQVDADQFAQHREVQRVVGVRQVRRQIGVRVNGQDQLERLDPVG